MRKILVLHKFSKKKIDCTWLKLLRRMKLKLTMGKCLNRHCLKPSFVLIIEGYHFYCTDWTWNVNNTIHGIQ